MKWWTKGMKTKTPAGHPLVGVACLFVGVTVNTIMFEQWDLLVVIMHNRKRSV